MQDRPVGCVEDSSFMISKKAFPLSSKGDTPNEGVKWQGGRENLRHPADMALPERDSAAIWWVQVTHYKLRAYIFSRRSSGAIWFCFTAPSVKLAKSRTDEIYGWSLSITSVRRCTAVARSCLRQQSFTCYLCYRHTKLVTKGFWLS